MTHWYRSRWLAPLGVLVVSVAFAVVGLVLKVDAGEGLLEPLVVYLGFLSFGVIGTIVLAKGGSRAMGWIFVGVTYLWTSGEMALDLANHLYASSDPGPLAPLAAWYVEWYWIPLIFSQLAVTPILFPNGTPMNARWRAILRVLVGAAIFFTLAAALDPKLDVDGRIVGNNFLGISPFGDLEDGVLGSLFFPFLFGSGVVGTVALILRFRRSRGEERQQMKWIVFTGVAFFTTFLGLVVLDTVGIGRPPLLDALLLILLPVGWGVAILRYRLYEIDVLINRTLVYALLTAVLVVAYTGLVFALGSLLEPITQESDLAVAASTLAVAALVRPVRARLQGFIDRRFYRNKYDASVTLAKFGVQLRDEVDLERLESGVVEAVKETVQPRHVTLWLRTES